MINHYGFFISLAIFISFLYLSITAYKKEMPLLFNLMFGILMSAPFLILGFRVWTLLFDSDSILEFKKIEYFNEKLKYSIGFSTGLKGLSFHGGFISGFLYIFFLFSWYSKKTKISKLYLFDWLIPAILIMQIIGRLGNYANDEIKEINGEKLFLYEMIGNFIILLIIKFLIPNLYKIISKKPWNKNIFWKNEISKNYIKFNKAKGFKKIKQYFIYLNCKNTFWVKVLNEYPKEKNNISIKIKGTNNFYYREVEINKKELYFFKKIYKRIKLLFLRDSSNLLKNNNPFDLKLVRVGVISFFYVVFSFSLRLGLQNFRKENDRLWITPYFLIISIILGVFFLFFFQFIFPKKYRSEGWYYESRY